MNQAVVDSYNADGTLNTRERSSYEYDMRSFRISQLAETWNETTGEFEFKSDTEFLVSHRNHTGYAQTLRETTKDENGSVTKTIDYTFGNDEIAQTVTENGETTTHIFGHDGHGSVRVLYDLAATVGELIAQIVTYSSYGVNIAMHSGNGAVMTAALSSLGYSGEHFDASIQKGYNRARWYDPRSAQWNRLDPFVGNNQDPQSLNKYGALHSDPIQNIDPTGYLIATLGNAVSRSLKPGLGGIVRAGNEGSNLYPAIAAFSGLAVFLIGLPLVILNMLARDKKKQPKKRKRPDHDDCEAALRLSPGASHEQDHEQRDPAGPANAILPESAKFRLQGGVRRTNGEARGPSNPNWLAARAWITNPSVGLLSDTIGHLVAYAFGGSLTHNGPDGNIIPQDLHSNINIQNHGAEGRVINYHRDGAVCGLVVPVYETSASTRPYKVQYFIWYEVSPDSGIFLQHPEFPVEIPNPT